MMKYLIFLYSLSVSCSPVSVVSGGTGTTAMTAYAVVCAGTTTTGSFQALSSVGTSGQALVSGGPSSLPAFGTVAIAGGGTGSTSLSSGVIQSNGTVLSSLGFGSANQVLTNTSSTVNWAFAGLLQIATTSTSARINTTGTSIPADDTIPQFSEGTLILSLAVTPKSASSTLIILFTTSGTPTSSTSSVIALYVDSGSNALAAQYISNITDGSSFSGILCYTTTSGSTSSRTYQIRIGGGNFQVNSGSSSRKFGGVASTYLTVFEIA